MRRLGGEGHADEDGVGVDEIGDDRHRHAVIGEGRPEEPGRALVQWPHGVSEMGHEACPGIDGFEGDLGGARRMAEGHEDAPGAQRVDGVDGAGKLGSEGDDAQHVGRGSRASVRSTTARTNSGRWAPGTARKGPSRWAPAISGRPRAVTARRGGDGGQRRLQRVEGCGDDGGAPRGHALGEQGLVEGVPVRAGGTGHVDGADPVDLEVDEPGDEDHVGDGRRARAGPR